MDPEVLKQIETLNPWFYDLTIDQTTVIPGIGSPHSPEQLMADAQYKRRVLVDAITDRYDFKGKKLLDIAANCGYWSSYYARHGATSLLAVEGREKFVSQGNLYWQYGRFMCNENYRFLLGDVNSSQTWNDIANEAPFDFVLCCGIMYHLQDHLLLLQRIEAVAVDAILIDTRVSLPGAKKTRSFVEKGDWKFDGVRYNDQPAIVAHPTQDSIRSFFVAHDYDIEEIRSPVPVHPLMSPNDDYDSGNRITLLCRRKQ